MAAFVTYNSSAMDFMTNNLEIFSHDPHFEVHRDSRVSMIPNSGRGSCWRTWWNTDFGLVTS